MIPQSPQPNDINPDEARQEQEQDTLSDLDFLADELSFAQELNSLFNLEQEELPPLFVQTLHNEQIDLMAPSRLEQRLRYRVFRKLQLPQRPLAPEQPRQEHPPKRVGILRTRSKILSLSALIAVLMVSLLAFGPSVIANLQLAVISTPNQAPSGYTEEQNASGLLTHYLSIRQTEDAIPFNTYWLGHDPGNYNYESLLLHTGQSWSDGPVVELQYGHSDPRFGYGRLILREFRPAANTITTLQVVPPEAVQTVQVTDDIEGIYINGRWDRLNGETAWTFNTEAQLLYQAKGLVFWVTVDLRDETTSTRLVNLVNTAMQQLYLGPPRPHLPELPSPPLAQNAPALGQQTMDASEEPMIVANFPDTYSTVYIALSEVSGNTG